MGDSQAMREAGSYLLAFSFGSSALVLATTGLRYACIPLVIAASYVCGRIGGRPSLIAGLELAPLIALAAIRGTLKAVLLIVVCGVGLWLILVFSADLGRDAKNPVQPTEG